MSLLHKRALVTGASGALAPDADPLRHPRRAPARRQEGREEAHRTLAAASSTNSRPKASKYTSYVVTPEPSGGNSR